METEKQIRKLQGFYTCGDEPNIKRRLFEPIGAGVLKRHPIAVGQDVLHYRRIYCLVVICERTLAEPEKREQRCANNKNKKKNDPELLTSRVNTFVVFSYFSIKYPYFR